jgi:hypothetical protein
MFRTENNSTSTLKTHTFHFDEDNGVNYFEEWNPMRCVYLNLAHTGIIHGISNLQTKLRLPRSVKVLMSIIKYDEPLP